MRSSVVEMAASTGRPCQLCCCRIDDGKNRRNVGASKSATAALDGLCSEVGQLRTQLVPGPVCRRCFQDLEKLTKAQSTVELLRGQFLCYLRSLKTTLQHPTSGQISQELVSEPVPQRKRPRDATDIGSPSSTSTPSGRPPVPKRPLVIREEKSRTRRSLEFGPDPSVNQAASPVVNVVSNIHSRKPRITAYTYKVAASRCPLC